MQGVGEVLCTHGHADRWTVPPPPPHPGLCSYAFAKDLDTMCPGGFS